MQAADARGDQDFIRVCDLIIIDIELPGQRPLSCRLCAAGRDRVAIVVISAHERENKVGAFAAGADDFVLKTRPRELLSRVAHIRRSAARARIEGSNREMGFLDTRRGLLRALEPQQLVRARRGRGLRGRERRALRAVLDADGEAATCVFDREAAQRAATRSFVSRSAPLARAAPALGASKSFAFFLRDEGHALEPPLSSASRASLEHASPPSTAPKNEASESAR